LGGGMMDIAYLVLGIVIGLLGGWLFASRKAGVPKLDYDNLAKQEATAQEKIRGLTEQLSTNSANLEKHYAEVLNLNRSLAEKQAQIVPLEESIKELKIERDNFKRTHAELSEKNSILTTKEATLETAKQLLEQQLKTLKETVDEVNKQAKETFENLANQVLETKTKAFNETTEKSLDILLRPLKEKIQTFEKSVEDKYANEARERFVLKSEIEKLITLNDKMALETNSLTLALRGDSKVQGDWGELVLERILESSGLRENQEYTLQAQHESDTGGKFKPDVIVNLPDNKHIIVDSKVSLTAYDRYRTNTDEAIQAVALREHIKSIEKHVDDLSGKHYAKLKGLNSPEFVFMFVPIEPAYLLAMQSDSELSVRAWKKGVAIVTSTTLLTSLKTVASIWRLENQNKNALQIAQEGANLYDKFVGFLEDFEKIGKTFESGQKQYADAMNKLKDGTGNVFRKMELLRELGSAPKKRIKQDLLE